jgi:CheY-like chemotaxis protein
MAPPKTPIAVRLLGLPDDEVQQIADVLMRAPKSGRKYFCLHEDSLQEPDILIANAEDLKAVQALAAANPGPLSPCLVLGRSEIALPYPHLDTPMDEQELLDALERLMDERAAALAESNLRVLPVVPERRRRDRLDLDLTDPAVYESQRRPPPNGAILIIDKGAPFRDHVAKLLASRAVSVEWTDSAATAVRLCDETPVSVVVINTSTPDIDPYGLCATIKAQRGSQRTAVVLLIGTGFVYNRSRAKAAGVRGLLDKPVSDRNLVSVLKKLLSMST